MANLQRNMAFNPVKKSQLKRKGRKSKNTFTVKKIATEYQKEIPTVGEPTNLINLSDNMQKCDTSYVVGAAVQYTTVSFVEIQFTVSFLGKKYNLVAKRHNDRVDFGNGVDHFFSLPVEKTVKSINTMFNLLVSAAENGGEWMGPRNFGSILSSTGAMNIAAQVLPTVFAELK